ncbi:hypothetical protein ACLKA6_011831 [Drosophila palustris]
MKQTFSAAICILLAVLYFNSLVATAAITTVRPYKFGFTIEEQQHRREQRDENGIVMGEFGFITADGKYHVTVYATDENGKFRIISMKSFPYAGPVASTTSTTTTMRAPLKKHNFNTAACSGCFLSNSAPAANGVSAVEAATPVTGPKSSGVQGHKTEIRPLSLPLSPAPAADPGKLVPPTQFFQSQAHKLAQLALSQLQAQAQAQSQAQGQAQGQTQGQTQDQTTGTTQGLPQEATADQEQFQLNYPSTVLPQDLAHAQSQGQPQFQLQLDPAEGDYVDKGVNVLLPFQQSIAQSIGSALAESQTHITLPQQHTQQQVQQQQHTTPTQHVSSSQSLHTLLNPNTFPTNVYVNKVNIQTTSIDLANVERIPAAASGPQDLNSHAFGASLTATQKQQQQQQPSSSNNGLAQTPTSAQSLPAYGQFAHVQGIPAAATGPKDLNTNAFSAVGNAAGSFPSLTATQNQQQQQPGLHSVIRNPSNLHSQSAYQPVHTLPNPSKLENNNMNFGNSKDSQHVPHSGTSAVNSLKINAEQSMKKIVLPLTQEINKFVSQHGPQSATPTQHKLFAQHTHATPAHSHINTHTVSLNRPLSTNSLTAIQKQQSQQPSTNISPTATNSGLAQIPAGAQSLPANGQATKPTLSKSPNLAVTGTKTGTGQASISNSPSLATTSTNAEAGQTGDLYRFKYLLDYNGHEETGSRNGNKEGNYFAIGEDAVARTIEYIANEFGFQPHISWRKLDSNEIANLPKENSLKHYEFKWFNKASE